MERTMCAALDESMSGERVRLCGWTARTRDLGGMLFVELRDASGTCQLVVDEGADASLLEEARRLGSEWVVEVHGTVRMRPPRDRREDVPAGMVEVVLDSLEVLSEARTPPFVISEQSRVSEELRLKYRYLDMRRKGLAERLRLRSRIAGLVHEYLQEQGFVNVDTPILTKSTPEGARDYLVPSRVNKGRFYALPQSPQLFKQLCMVGGIERYYQLCRCFRDEDLRADRQPEFTQIDMEVSFMDRNEFFGVVEGLLHHVASRLGVEGLRFEIPFRRMSWREAMDRFGTDKPDLRYGLELVDLTADLLGKGFKAIDGACSAVSQGEGVVSGLLVPAAVGPFSRKELDSLAETARKAGAGGLLPVRWKEDGTVASPLCKVLGEEFVAGLLERLGGAPGDLLLITAGAYEVSRGALGAVRSRLLKERDVPRTGGEWEFVWITDFPWLEWDEEESRWVARHHPFTAPLDEDLHLIDEAPWKVRAKAYDLVLNGWELGGGSFRIHTRPMQEKMFSAIGIDAAEAEEKFGFLLEAFGYGVPPHGGIALGFDRLCALFCGVDSIREVIAFPKTSKALCLLTGAPSTVDPAQLRELGISPASEREEER